MIILACAHPGDYNSLYPIAATLLARKMPHRFAVDAGSFAASKLAESDRTFIVPSAEVFLNRNGTPKVVITGMGSAIGRELTDRLKGKAITIAVQDQWGARFDEWAGDFYRPDYFITNDAVGMAVTGSAFPQMNVANILPFGFPALDRVAHMNPEKEKKGVREMLQIKDGVPLVYYSAQFVQSGHILHELINALNYANQEAVVVAGKHPRFPVEQFPEEARLWETAPELQKGRLFIGSQNIEAISLVAASDLVISGYSNALVEACVMRKPAISIQWPEVVEFYNKETKGFVPIFPPVALGCVFTTLIPNVGQLGATIVSALDANNPSTEFNRERQEKHFKADGLAADRVADLAISLYTK